MVVGEKLNGRGKKMKKFICGGSFRSKLVEKNDDFKVVKLSSNTEIKLLRSSSLTKPERSSFRKIFVLPPKTPDMNAANKRVFLEPSKEVR